MSFSLFNVRFQIVINRECYFENVNDFFDGYKKMIALVTLFFIPEMIDFIDRYKINV